jgi:hypothetical protein
VSGEGGGHTAGRLHASHRRSAHSHISSVGRSKVYEHDTQWLCRRKAAIKTRSGISKATTQSVTIRVCWTWCQNHMGDLRLQHGWMSTMRGFHIMAAKAGMHCVSLWSHNKLKISH